jgi:hypothetical protein
MVATRLNAIVAAGALRTAIFMCDPHAPAAGDEYGTALREEDASNRPGILL